MKKMLACLLAVMTIGLFAQNLHWTTDYNKALEMSRRSGKPVFAFFTGSDWCGWCIRLDKEILSKRDMVHYLNQNFVLFKADFPRKNAPPPHVMKKNRELARQFGVRGYPTIIIVDRSGKKIGQTGYMRGGPEAMKRALNQYIRKAPPPRKPAPAPKGRAPQRGRR